ncbi:MAG: alpha-amylase [Candidatus Bathyarchaeota archaeon B26-1]|nr:MAG: alpha-amylase [Candidatus Bathyarchaeota archaeon B26-1]
MLKIIRRNMEELEKTIRLMEMHLTKIEVDYAAGELGEERYLKERDILTSGIELLKERLEHMKRLAGEASLEAAPEERAETILREVPAERAFYFYTDYGKYTGTYARSLEEFAETLEKISVESIRFHLRRGDFQVWIRDLGDPGLAEALDSIDEPNLNDRELREEVARRVRERVEDLKTGLTSS